VDGHHGRLGLVFLALIRFKTIKPIAEWHSAECSGVQIANLHLQGAWPSTL